MTGIELDTTEAALALAGLVALQELADKIAPEKVDKLADRLEGFITEEEKA